MGDPNQPNLYEVLNLITIDACTTACMPCTCPDGFEFHEHTIRRQFINPIIFYSYVHPVQGMDPARNIGNTAVVYQNVNATG